MLHNRLPAAEVESTVFPQLFTTVTVGTEGVAIGEAVPLPGALLHPFSVAVTVYGPALFTVIDEVVSPVLHNRSPVAAVERMALPQLLITETNGVAGVDFGAAVPLPGVLLQPFSVEVTVYGPALFTVIEDVVSPVLHNRSPDAVVACGR